MAFTLDKSSINTIKNLIPDVLHYYKRDGKIMTYYQIKTFVNIFLSKIDVLPTI